MNSGKNRAAGGAFGYTVIEVMIVLAISGLMFVLAANFIAGRQEKTSFSQGVDAMASQLQNTIEQVTDGQYGDTPLTCTAQSSKLVFALGGAQGTNTSCDYLGKLLHFYGNSKAGYEVFTLAGTRVNLTSNQPPDCLSAAVGSCGSALPTAIDDPSDGVNLTTQETVPQNLSVNSVTVKVVDPVTGVITTPTTYAFGFVQGLGTADAGNQVNNSDSFQTGAQVISLVYAPGVSSASMSEPSAVSAIANNLLTATSATLCLSDGTQFAQIGVGDSSTNGNQLTVNVTMLGTTSCP